jgi:predicted naringenin-chalcone synthase
MDGKTVHPIDKFQIGSTRMNENRFPCLLGFATASPTYTIPQHNSVAVASSFVHDQPKVTKVLPAVYRRTQVQRRASVLLEGPSEEIVDQTFYPPAVDTLDRGPTTANRMLRFQTESGPIACRAAAAALRDASIAAESITHLVTVTCTGFYSPGFDIDLIVDMGLSRDVQRVQVGFMGCHAVVNALRVARAIVQSDPDAKVLIVSVELCSLHYQYGGDADSIIANALFADGCGALVVGQRDQHQPEKTESLRIRDTGSRLVADSRDAMSWSIGDNGYQMTLAATVPGIIERELHGYLESYLGHRGMKISDIAGWAVHPGGPRVLGSVEKALGLPSTALEISRDVLGQNGNMSSATLVFILQRMRELEIRTPWLMLGFGPGLEIELALLT